MKELDDKFLQDYFESLPGVELPVDFNERVMAHISKTVSERLAHQRMLVWSCVATVVVALGGLFGYLYYVGAVEFKAVEFSAIDFMWLFLCVCVTSFMVLSLYLSRRLDRGRV